MLRLSWDSHVNFHRSLSGFQQIVLSSAHSLYLHHTAMAALEAWLFLLLVKSEAVCHSTAAVGLPLWHGPRALELLHECPKPVLAATRTCLSASQAPCWGHGFKWKQKFWDCSHIPVLPSALLSTFLGCEVNRHLRPPVELHQNLWLMGQGSRGIREYLSSCGINRFMFPWWGC